MIHLKKFEKYFGFSDNYLEHDKAKDEQIVKDFFVYYNTDKAFFDIWKYCKNEFNITPSLITNSYMQYNTKSSYVIVRYRNTGIMLEEMKTDYNMTRRLSRSCKFSYKDLKEFLNYD